MEAVLAKLAEYGLLGILLAYFIWRDAQKDKQIDALLAANSTIQEKRVTESAKSVEALGLNAAANSKVADALSSMSDNIERLEDHLSPRRGARP